MAAIPQGVAIASPDKAAVRATNPCPKEITMPTTTIALAELVENGADINVLRQLV